MIFTKEQILSLENIVRKNLSEKRFRHTLGVVRAAKKIAEFFPCVDPSELSVAALLHDITKEFSTDQQLFLFDKGNFRLLDSDKNNHEIWHSLSAPIEVSQHYSEFATKNVLSAIFNHTTGCENMSIFDEIIFISDYIEEGRTYESCVTVRNELFEDLNSSKDDIERELSLHNSVFRSLCFTENEVLKRGRIFNERGLVTKKYFADLLDNK